VLSSVISPTDDEVAGHGCQVDGEERTGRSDDDDDQVLLFDVRPQAMGSMNKQMDVAKVAQTMQQFSKVSAEMDMKQEISMRRVVRGVSHVCSGRHAGCHV
jgi:hypothetical protein